LGFDGALGQPRGSAPDGRAQLRKALGELALRTTAGLGVSAVAPSPLRGADGNVEFFVHARRGRASVAPAAIDAAVQRAQDARETPETPDAQDPQ